MEILTFISSYLLKAIQNHIAANQEIRKMELQIMQQNAQMENAAQTEIRSQMLVSPVLAVTASILAVIGFFSIVLLPKLVCLFAPDVAVTYACLDLSKGFLFFTNDATKMFFKSVKGLLITPIDTNLIAGIAGLYFGSVTGRRG